MERKAKLGFTAAGIVGLVFGILGAVYAILGVVIYQHPQDSDDTTVGIVFGCLGIVFFAVALVLLAVVLRKRAIANRLLNSGRYIWGEVADITANYSVRVNNRHPYVILVRYQDARGQVHLFRSHNIYRYPDRAILGRPVKVYYENDSFRHYYVDLEGALPTVIEH